MINDIYPPMAHRTTSVFDKNADACDVCGACFCDRCIAKMEVAQVKKLEEDICPCCGRKLV